MIDDYSGLQKAAILLITLDLKRLQPSSSI